MFCNEREQLRRWRQQLVTRSIAESDAAWGATGNRGRHRQERRLSAPVYAKKGALALAKAPSYKSGDDLLSHKRLQYHRPAVDKGD